MTQVNLFDEIIVDNFAGGGGASTGIELAAGRPVTVAVNHDPDAILMHKTNHPHTKHYCESVWDIDPAAVCHGRSVGLAWFSPDCKHFSKAKGGKPVDKHIRGLAWVALRWAGTVHPRVIILENVEEFQTWGPVRRGRPVKSKAGQTFRKFVFQLEALGYTVEWRELVAADYGAPTIRKRFFLIARCDGRPIVWPERTHAPRDSAEVRTGRYKPWRSAAEIIDWSLPCPSIFKSKAEIKAEYALTAVRPLAENTMRRIICGVDKFTIRSGRPFIVPIGYGERRGQAPRVQDINAPVSTVVSSAKQYLCSPLLTQYHDSPEFRGQHVDTPILTIDGANRYGLVTAQLTEFYGNGKALEVSQPMHTITAKDREALTLAHIAEFKGRDKGQSAEMPLRTLTAGGGEFAVVYTRVERYDAGADMGYWPDIRSLLNKYCGYALAEDEVILLHIGDAWYFIFDIGLRMLIPRELYDANGFPADYIIDRDYRGNSYGKSKQVARCGNAVPPPFAAALVRANLPEWCGIEINTMRELEEVVAV